MCELVVYAWVYKSDFEVFTYLLSDIKKILKPSHFFLALRKKELNNNFENFSNVHTFRFVINISHRCSQSMNVKRYKSSVHGFVIHGGGFFFMKYKI